MDTSTNTFDAEDYLCAIIGAIDDAASLVGEGETVSSVGISCLAMSLVGISSSGDPVTPVYTYADSATGEGHVDHLRAMLGSPDAVRSTQVRTGTPIHSSYAPALFTRLFEGEGKMPRAIARWATLSSFVLSRLTGVEQPITTSEASWTGLLDSRHLPSGQHPGHHATAAAGAGTRASDGSTEMKWDAELLGQLGVEEGRLPRLCDVGSAHVGGLSPEFAARWPCLRGATWARGIGDGAAANLGAGCTEGGKVCISIGTSAAMRVCVGRRGAEGEAGRVPHGLWRYVLDEERFLVGGALTDGGSAYAWAMRGAGDEEARNAEELAGLLLPDAHGLTVLPFWSGERSPGYMSGAKAVITGLSLDTCRPALLRAVMEAVGLRLAAILSLLRPLAGETGVEVFATGGALCASPLWQRILADCIGVPLTVCPGLSEASCLGAAVLGARGAGIDVRAPHPAGEVVNPSPGGKEAMSAALERQESLYAAIYPPQHGR